MKGEIKEITNYFSRKSFTEISLEKYKKEEKEIEKFILKLEEEGLKSEVFKLDILLKGLRAYFNLQNHPRKTKSIWNMSFEMKYLSSVVSIIKSTFKNIYKMGEVDDFKHFIESKFKSSLEFLLKVEDEKKNWKMENYFSSFNIFLDKLSTIVDAISRLEYVNYREFVTVGDYFLEVLVRNKYLYPFVRRNFRVQFHRVVHPEIGKAIKEVDDKVKKYFSGLILVEAFKILKVTELIEPESQKHESLNFFVFVFLKEELQKFKKILYSANSLSCKEAIISDLNELEEKVYSITLTNILFRKNKKSLYKRAFVVYRNSIEGIINSVLDEISGGKVKFEAPYILRSGKEKDKLINIINEIDRKVDNSLTDIESYKKELLKELSVFEREYLVYFSLRVWEKFYKLFFAIKHSPHKVNLLKKVKELKLFLKELKEKIEEN